MAESIGAVLEKALILGILFGLAVAISLVVVGLPAAMLKWLAATLCAHDRSGLTGKSVRWAALVGAAMVAIQMAANLTAIQNKSLREFISEIGGWHWTVIGFVILGAMALTIDYWKVVRPLQPRLSTIRAGGFLLFSNIWILGGGLMLVNYNTMTLFPSCWDPVEKRMVNVILETRPEVCDEISD